MKRAGIYVDNLDGEAMYQSFNLIRYHRYLKLKWTGRL